MEFEKVEESKEIEKQDTESRQKQRQWLASLLDAKLEGKPGKYRLKDEVPMPPQHDYMVRIDGEPCKVGDENHTALFMFLEKSKGVKKPDIHGRAWGELGVSSNLEHYLQKHYLPVNIGDISPEKIGIKQDVKLKLNPVKVKFPQYIKRNAPIGPDTLKLMSEIKQRTGTITGKDTTFTLDAKVDSKMKLQEKFGKSDIDYSVRSVDAKEIIKDMDTAINKAVTPVDVTIQSDNIGLSGKLDMTLPTIDTSCKECNIKGLDVSKIYSASKMDVTLPSVKVEIKDLAKEILGQIAGRKNNTEIAEMMKKMASFTVNMPDFTDVWNTIK